MNNHIMVRSDIAIAGVPFCLQYQYGKEENLLVFMWKRESQGPLSLTALSDMMSKTPMGFDVPEEFFHLNVSLTSVFVYYDFSTHAFKLRLEAMQYGSFTIAYKAQDTGKIGSFILQMKAKFFLGKLPVLGNGLSADDYVALEEFSLRIVKKEAQTEARAGVKLAWKLGQSEIHLSLPPDESSGQEDYGLEKKGDAPFYLDVNKDFSILHLSRVGFRMGDGEVVLYVDAGIRLSILMLEFIGLSLGIPLAADKKVTFGLQGLAVTVARPPLFISGGLSISKNSEITLFTGEVKVQIKNIGVTALCSYGEFQSGEDSLFAFLLLEAGLGGPPVFYITGLAGGFGYNRSICLPAQVQDVEQFPFVAAAMGKGGIKAGMTPAEVLTKMDKVIIPCIAQYFLSVGIRFNSFGMVESFALLNIEFGKRFVCSLLGLSRLSLPLGAAHPFVLIKLAIKAVIAPDDGWLGMEGALSGDSYILNQDCRINGGFAFYVWFGVSEHAGDFVITLGGYKSGYNVAHYPKVDRLSVNWKMDSHLTLSADAYFALTPSCVMLGGHLAIVYENGRLKAWLKAWAEFFMQWKPFLYDISIGISIGASYRWDFFPFYKTFKVELGADLHLWGPPFGGEVHISWFIISFTVCFGEGKPQPEAVDWDIFAADFLNCRNVSGIGKDADTGEKSVISIKPSQGVVCSGEKTGIYLMNADHLKIEVSSSVMSTQILRGKNPIAKRDGLGIVPMKVSRLCSTLTLECTDENGRDVPELKEIPVYSNAPRAVWDSAAPSGGDTDNLLPNVPSGICITCERSKPKGLLPATGSYDMKILCANEKLTPHLFAYEIPAPIEKKNYPKEQILEQVEKSIGRTGGRRMALLNTLSDIFPIWTEEELALDNWKCNLENQLLAEPELAVIGADV